MLQNDFFTVVASGGEGSSFLAKLSLNARHRIFEGHFPGQPVVPGVCLMQMVQEVLKIALGGMDLRLMRAEQIKFIALIDPVKNPELEMKLDCRDTGEPEVKVVASLSYEGKVCFKFSGVFMRE